MLVNQELSGLIPFLKQDDWPDFFLEVHGQHLGNVLDQVGREADDLAILVGAEATIRLWGCAFEDFLTRTFGADHRNLIDTYLAKRAWKETPRAKAYMKALRTSVMSLYEVTSLVPGKSFKARDLLRGGNVVTVSADAAGRDILEGDVMACRVLSVLGKTIVSDGRLEFEDYSRRPLLGLMQQLTGRDTPPPWADLKDEHLRLAASIFSSSWLTHEVSHALADDDDNDEEDLVFHEIAFPLASGVKHKDIQAALSRVPDLVAEPNNNWTWTNGETDPNDFDLFDGLGMLELKGRTLTLTVQSDELEVAGIDMLTEALEDLVGEPTITRESVDDILADPEYADLFADDDDFDDMLDDDTPIPANDR